MSKISLKNILKKTFNKTKSKKLKKKNTKKVSKKKIDSKKFDPNYLTDLNKTLQEVSFYYYVSDCKVLGKTLLCTTRYRP